MTDNFAHARLNARADCPKCKGTGRYDYDDRYFAICDLCCKHDRGWALLGNGLICCTAGCGRVKAPA